MYNTCVTACVFTHILDAIYFYIRVTRRPDFGQTIFQPFVRTAVASPPFCPFILLFDSSCPPSQFTTRVGFQMPKRKTSFKLTWSSELRFYIKSSKDQYHAFCKLCHIDIDMSRRGKWALERHACTTQRHKDNASSAGHSSFT